MRKLWKRVIALGLTVVMIGNILSVMPVKADSYKKQENEVVVEANYANAFDYALFTGDESKTLEMNASKIEISGDVHSNSDFVYRGSLIDIDGVCEASDDITISVSDRDYIDKIGELKENTKKVELPDYSQQIYNYLMENNCATYYNWTSFSDRYVSLKNGICVEGTLGVYSSQFTGSGIIYARDGINYSAANITNADEGMLVLCAANGDINIYASNTTINGVIYAPNGTVTITGSNVQINGRIISDKFNFWGSNLVINKGEGDLELLDFLFGPTPEIKATGE